MGKPGREIGREVAAAFKESCRSRRWDAGRPLSQTLFGVVHRAARREAWHPQGPPTSTQPPRATTFWGSPYPQMMARRA